MSPAKPPNDVEASDAGERHRISIDAASRAVLLVGAALYALGLLTTNLYLIALGVSDFALLRPRYVLTGLDVVLLAAFSWAAPLLFKPPRFGPRGAVGRFLDRVENVIRRSLRRRRAPVLSSIIAWLDYIQSTLVFQLLPFGVYALFVTATTPTERADTGRALLDAFVLWSSGLAATVCTFLVLVRISGREGDMESWLRSGAPAPDTVQRTTTWERLSSTAALSITAVLFIALHLAYFSGLVLPAIPEPLGGVSPRWVSLVLASTSPWRDPELGLVDATGTPVRVQLLFESDAAFVLRVESTVVVVDSREVSGLIVAD